MLHYSKLIIKYNKNIEKHGQQLTKLQEKKKTACNRFQKKIFLEKNEITDIKSIAENFNNYFTEIGLTLAKKIESSSVTFHKYLEAYNITQPEKDLVLKEKELQLIRQIHILFQRRFGRVSSVRFQALMMTKIKLQGLQ